MDIWGSGNDLEFLGIGETSRLCTSTRKWHNLDDKFVNSRIGGIFDTRIYARQSNTYTALRLNETDHNMANLEHSFLTGLDTVDLCVVLIETVAMQPASIWKNENV